MLVQHWFDFLCPYCYVAQDRNKVLRAHGLGVVEHGLQIHPEIGPGGTPAGPRSGPSYDFLAREAEAAGLPLHWSDRIPYSRPALAAFEWLHQTDPEAAERFIPTVFQAYFAYGLDIESIDLLATLATQAGADEGVLRGALASTEANDALKSSEARAHQYGIAGTPTWIANGQRLSGLHPRQTFEDWATALNASAPASA
jgi:predicted DsbA family dithiol-disulfide isomerase